MADESAAIDASVVALDTPAPDAGAAEDAALGAIFDKLVTQNGADRGSDGKFASDKPVEAKPAETPAEAKPAETPAAAAAPAHLPQAIKAHWDKYPPEAQAAIAAHQSEMDKKFGDIGKQFQPAKQVYDRLNEAISKHPDFKGLTPDDLGKGAARLAAVQVAFTKNPVGTLLDLANSAGIRDQLVQALGVKVEPGDANQLIQGMQQKINNLEAQLKGVSDPEKFRETVSSTIDQRMVWKEAETEFKDWSKDQPFYSDIEADLPYFVGKVIESKGLERPRKEILNEAYDMAINAHPEVRAKVRAAEAKATAATPDPKRTEAARKAASINVKSSANGKDRPVTEEEAMASAYDRAMASTH